MDKLEYISGDLVMTNGVPLGTAQNVVYRVTSSDPSKTLKLDDETVLKGVVCLENIEGAEFGDKGYLSGDRLTKLRAALNKDGFLDKVGDVQYDLMIKQLYGMNNYHNALKSRMIDMGIFNDTDCCSGC